MPKGQVQQELTGNRATIEALTGRVVDSYSFPGTTRHTRALVRISQLGYRRIDTPFIGAVAPGSVSMMVRRIMVDGIFDIAPFLLTLRGLKVVVLLAMVAITLLVWWFASEIGLR
jgi:hypothetical protein